VEVEIPLFFFFSRNPSLIAAWVRIFPLLGLPARIISTDSIPAIRGG
jgi:hypothetical protein